MRFRKEVVQMLGSVYFASWSKSTAGAVPIRLVEVVTWQVRDTWPAQFTVTSVTAQSDGRVLSWFQCWKSLLGRVFRRI